MKSKTSKGFTLIEIIISIFVLSVAIVGIFGAFSLVVILTSNSSDRLVAAYLAQEGIEIVRNVRDTNFFNESSPGSTATWLDGLDNCISAYGCQADYTTGSATNSFSFASSATPPAALYLYKDSNGFYNYRTGIQTKFKRQIIIEKIADANSNSSYIIKVTVNVFWDQKPSIMNSGGLAGESGSGEYTVEEYLYNWYKLPAPVTPPT